MSWLSFRGRITRSRFWLGYVLPLTLASIVIQGIGVSMMMSGPKDVFRPSSGYLQLLHLFLLWPSLAGTVKRLHDRNRSGGWAFAYWLFVGLPWLAMVVFMAGVALHGSTPGAGIGLGLIAFGLVIAFFALTIWLLVEIGFLRGTLGPNRFGPDPLNPNLPPPGYWAPSYGPPPGYGPPPHGAYQPPQQPPPPGSNWGASPPPPWQPPPPR